MNLRAYYRNDWLTELDQAATDITEWLENIDAFERKIDDEFLNGRLILFQTMHLSFIYFGDMKNIIDQADESKIHCIWIEAQLPESGAWKKILHGAIDLRTVETDKDESVVSFELRDKLAYASMFSFSGYRNKDFNLYSEIRKIDGNGNSVSLDYSSGDRLVMITDVDGVKIIGVNAGLLFNLDVSLKPFSNGEIIKYYNNNYTKRLFVLSNESSTIEDNNDISFDCFSLSTYGVKAKAEDYPVGNCQGFSGCYEFPEDFTLYNHLVYGEDIYARNDDNSISDIDGVKLLKAILIEADTASTVVTNGITSKAIGVKDWYSLTLQEPSDMAKQLKKLAEKCDVSLFVNNNFNYVIQKRFYYLLGAERSYDDWQAKETDFKRCVFDIVKRYVCKVDGNDGVIVTNNVDNGYFSRGKTEELELNYNGVTTDEQTLKDFADLYCALLMDFYGKRHEGYTAEIILMKDAYFKFELYDRIGDLTTGYFIYAIKFDFEKSAVILNLAEMNGHEA